MFFWPISNIVHSIQVFVIHMSYFQQQRQRNLITRNVKVLYIGIPSWIKSFHPSFITSSFCVHYCLLFQIYHWTMLVCPHCQTSFHHSKQVRKASSHYATRNSWSISSGHPHMSQFHSLIIDFWSWTSHWDATHWDRCE